MPRDPKSEWLTERYAIYRALSDRVMDRCLEAMRRKHGIKAALCLGDFEFLAAVANAPEQDASMAQIARLLGVNPSSATRRNRRLLGYGLVENCVDERDERRYKIALTPRGRAFWTDVDRALLEASRAMYSSVTEEEMDCVYAVTEKCIANLQRILEEEG